MPDDPKTVKFHYIKARNCRDVHASGFFGGINPKNGNLHISVFTERPPIPKSTSYAVNEDGTLGAENTSLRDSLDGVVRVIQDTLYMDLSTALALHKWLHERIGEFKAANPDVIEEVKK